MLARARWLARTLINLLRRGWGLFSAAGLWRESWVRIGKGKKGRDETAAELPELTPEAD